MSFELEWIDIPKKRSTHLSETYDELWGMMLAHQGHACVLDATAFATPHELYVLDMFPQDQRTLASICSRVRSFMVMRAMRDSVNPSRIYSSSSAQNGYSIAVGLRRKNQPARPRKKKPRR